MRLRLSTDRTVSGVYHMEQMHNSGQVYVKPLTKSLKYDIIKMKFYTFLSL